MTGIYNLLFGTNHLPTDIFDACFSGNYSVQDCGSYAGRLIKDNALLITIGLIAAYGIKKGIEWNCSEQPKGKLKEKTMVISFETEVSKAISLGNFSQVLQSDEKDNIDLTKVLDHNRSVTLLEEACNTVTNVEVFKKFLNLGKITDKQKVLKAVEILVEKGSNEILKLLIKDIRVSLFLFQRDDNEKIFHGIQFLLKAATNYATLSNLKAEKGNLTLQKRNFEVFETFLKSFMSALNTVDNQGRTPIFRAIEMENVKVLEAFVQGGADLRVENKEKQTPLAYYQEIVNKKNKTPNNEITKLLTPQ